MSLILIKPFSYLLKQLDAVILQKSDEILFCVNTFSPRHKRLQQTKLYRLFEDKNELIEPYKQEEQGECFILDSNYVDRTDLNEIVKHLKDKYGLYQVTIPVFYLVNYPLD